MTASMKPVATSHGNVPEASLDGIVRELDAAVLKEPLKSSLVIKYVVYRPMDEFAILIPCKAYLFKTLHYPADYLAAVL